MIYVSCVSKGMEKNLKKRGAYDEEDKDLFGFGLLVCGRLGLLSSGRSGGSGVESR